MEVNDLIVIFLGLCFSCTKSVNCFNVQDVYNLHTNLFGNYNVQIPPYDGTRPIMVSIELSLLDVYSLDMKTQLFSTSVALKLSWSDIFLKWNKSYYGNLTETTMSLQNIWKPDIIIINSVDHEKELFRIADDRNVILKNGGLVEVKLFLNLRTRCLIDTTYYPFDTQSCGLKFSKRYLMDQYQISSSNLSNFDGIVSNGEWEVLDLDAKDKETGLDGKLYHNVIFMTSMRRLRDFYTWNFIVPVGALALADLFTFFVPAKSSEKMGVSIFVFLSLGVLTRLFNESIPSSSREVSLFGRLLWINILISGCIILAHTISTALFYWKSPKSISDCCICLTKFFKCKICRCCNCCCTKNRDRNKIKRKNNKEIEHVTQTIQREETTPKEELVATCSSASDNKSTSKEPRSCGPDNSNVSTNTRLRKGKVITRKDIEIDFKDYLEDAVIHHDGLTIEMGALKNVHTSRVDWSDVSRNLDLIFGVIFFLVYIGVFSDVIDDMMKQQL